MKIYTGTCAGKKLEKVRELNMGLMISPSPSFGVRPQWKGIPCALDNGAYQAWTRGFPFREKLFLETIDEAYLAGIKLDFIVCPDIVAGGKRSLAFSLKWARKLVTVPNLYLVLQDGMVSGDITKDVLSHFDGLFLGGTAQWKESTIAGWCEFAHTYKLPIHIGRYGTLPRLKLAYKCGAASVDSTNFARNDSWHLVEQFRKDIENENHIPRRWHKRTNR